MRNPFSKSSKPLTPPPERPATVVREDGSVHPFDVYYNPDAPAPRVDSVKSETLTAEQIDRRASRLPDAAVDGFNVEAAARAQIDARRHADQIQAQLDARRAGGSS